MSTTSKNAPEQTALLDVPATEKPERQEEAKSSARYASPRPFREWQAEQGQLLLQYAREVLGEGHLACFFVGLRKALDFSPIWRRGQDRVRLVELRTAEPVSSLLGNTGSPKSLRK